MRFKTEVTFSEKDGSVHRITNIIEAKDMVEAVEKVRDSSSKYRNENTTKFCVSALTTKLKLSKKVK
jgi:hypothetical protein